jgi:hypothetical protein
MIDEVMAQEGDAIFVGEPEHWLTSFTGEDFELQRGILRGIFL